MSSAFDSYLSQAVVLDTGGPMVFLGTLREVNEAGFVLEDADVHDCRAGHATAEAYVNEARALQMPVDHLVSNGAYRVMASLAWTLKAWFALLLPAHGRWKERYRSEKQSVLKMEFKRFVNALVRVPCQVLRTGRRLVYRLLAWNPWQAVFLRGVEALRRPLRC